MWIFDCFSYICIAFFLTLGLVRILWKNKRESYTEEICQKIPDEKMVVLVRKINKSILFFGFLSIILAFIIIVAEFVFNNFDDGDIRTVPVIIIVIGIILNCSPSSNRLGSAHMGMLWSIRDEIFNDYKEQEFNKISEWRDNRELENLGLVEKKDNQKYIKRIVNMYYFNFYSTIIGKITFYIGTIGIIVFY